MPTSRVNFFLIIILSLLIVLNSSLYFFGVAKARALLIEEEETMERLREELKKSRELEKIKTELENFRQRLPAKDDVTRIIEGLSNTAKKNRLEIPNITYSHQEIPREDLIGLSISFQIKGNYKGLRRFIYEIEKEGSFMGIESLTLSSAHGGGVNLQVKMATFLRR